MAKYGADVTTLSQPSLAGASHIGEGVVDRSKGLDIAATGTLVNQIGATGKEAYQGYQLAQEQNKLNDAIQEQKDSMTIFKTPDPTTTPSVQSFNEQSKTNLSGLKQGRYSELEFDIKMKKLLKDAIDRNPGLTDDLIKQADQTYKLSGLKSMFDLTNLVAQSQADQTKQQQEFILSVAKEAKTPLMFNSDGTTDFYGMHQENTKYQMEQQTLRGAENLTKFTTDQFRQFGTTYAVGKINQVTNLAVEILNDPTGSYDKKITQVNMLFDSLERDFSADPRVGPIIDQPPVKSTIDFLKTQVAAIKKNLADYSSGELAAKYLETQTKILRDQQYQDISKVTNPQAVELISKLVANVGVADFITTHPELKVQLYDSISKLANGISLRGSSTLLSSAPGEKPAAATLLDSGIKNTSPEHLNNIVDSVNGGVDSLPLPDKFNFYRDYVKTFANENNKEAINKLTPDRKEKIISNVSDYSAITFNDLVKSMSKYISNGEKVTVDILPNGHLTIQSNNPQTNIELQKKYLFRINDSLSAYAQLKGYSSSKEAAKSFFAQYREFLVPIERTQRGGTVRHINPQTTEGTIKQ